jgi:hypothetical protein
VKILNRWTNACIFESEHATMRETVEAAVKAGSNLRGSNLRGSDLEPQRLGPPRLGNEAHP